MATVRARTVASGEARLDAYTPQETRRVVDQALRLAASSARQRARNERAARYPWLPGAPDLP